MYERMPQVELLTTSSWSVAHSSPGTHITAGSLRAETLTNRGREHLKLCRTWIQMESMDTVINLVDNISIYIYISISYHIIFMYVCMYVCMYIYIILYIYHNIIYIYYMYTSYFRYIIL